MGHEQSDFLFLQRYAQPPDSSYCRRYTAAGMEYFSSQLVTETSWINQNNFDQCGDHGDGDQLGIEEMIYPSISHDFLLDGGDNIIQDPSSIYNPNYTNLSQDHLLNIDPSTMSMINHNHVFPTPNYNLFESSIQQLAFTPSSTFSNHPEPIYDSTDVLDLNGMTTSFSPKANSMSPLSIFATKVYNNDQPCNQESGNMGMITKRPRMEMPSPMPTFKVRKEKLGDRVTALQQLVSPFGKNDTASVLNEAAEYIKFLHNQVLSATNINNDRNSIQQQHQQMNDDKRRSGLRNRGLCLVPISSTFTIDSNESSSPDNYWTPTMFGGTFR